MVIEIAIFLLGMFVAWFFVAPPQVARDVLAKLVAKFPALERYQRDDDKA
jgi:hypothetical protein